MKNSLRFFLYFRQGYLYVQGKKSMKMGQGWYKYFCQLLQVEFKNRGDLLFCDEIEKV